MRRSPAVLVPLALAALLVGVALAGGTTVQTGGDDTAGVANYENVTNYLALSPDEVGTSESATAAIDVGLDVGVDGRDLQVTHEYETFRDQFDAAEIDANRTAAYERIITSIEERTDELYARTNGIVASHAQGAVSSQTLLRERAAISDEADRLNSLVQDEVGELYVVANDAVGYDLTDDHTDRLGRLDGRLQMLQGPISERTAQLADGSGGTQSVYTESSPTGYVFALVEDDTYVRESYLGDEYDPTLSNQFVDSDEGSDVTRAAFDRAGELYPTTNPAGIEWHLPSAIYEVPGSLPFGEVTVYLDGGTTNPFREDLSLNASRLPVSATDETSNGTTAMSVSRTFETGPMEVVLRDSMSDDPIDATVTVDGQQVGETGDDGTLWAVEPRGDVTVEATTAEGETVTSTLDSGAPTVQGG